MGILFFTKGDRSVPSSRERVWEVASRLQKNFNFDYLVLSGFQYPWWLLSTIRIKKIREAWKVIHSSRYEVIFVHKSLFTWDILSLIFLSRKKIIYDLDDAEWIHSSVKSKLLARRAQAVFCGSHAILKWAQKYNKQSFFIPTVVDASLYAQHSVGHRNKKELTIGWVGQGRAHFKAGNFQIIKKVLDEFALQEKNFYFIIVGSQNYLPLKAYFKNVSYRVEFIDGMDWQDPSSVPQVIKKYEFDIGVMPLRQTLFNEAKSALKAVEYMACGVVTIASSIGEAKYLIQNGENGFLAEDGKSWLKLLIQCSGDLELRKKVGMNAQLMVQKKYSFDVIVPVIAEHINALSQK